MVISETQFNAKFYSLENGEKCYKYILEVLHVRNLASE